MRKKTLVAIAAITVLGAGLAGCASDGADSSSDANTLNISTVSNEKSALDVVVPLFEKANPGVKVNVTTSALDQYQPALRTQLSSGTAPDMFGVWPGDGNPAAMLTLQPGGFLADLSDVPGIDGFPEAIKSVSQVEGKTYVAPLAFSGIGPIYNKTALAEAGLEVPETWTELLTFCTDAKEKTGKPAFYLAAGTNWNTQLISYALTPTLVYGPNPNFAAEMSAGTASFAGSAWADAFDKYLELETSGCFEDSPLGVSYESAVTALAQGETYAAVFVTSGLAALRAEAPAGTEFAMEALPATDNADDTRMPGAAGSAWAINAKAKNPDLAKKFLAFLLSPEGISAYTTANGSLPAIPGDAEVDPGLVTLQAYQAADKTDPWMDQLWPNARVQATHFQVIQDLLAGTTTVDAGLKAMDEAYLQGK